MRHTLCMRTLLLLLAAVALTGCPHHSSRTTPVNDNPGVTPGSDLGAAEGSTGAAGEDDDIPDPRRVEVTDLDVMHATADGEATTPGPLLDKGNAAFTAGNLIEAIRWYRELVDEFPDSKLAPAALFNIGLAHEKVVALDAAVGAYEELAKTFTASPEALDGELRAAAIYADRKQWVQAAAILTIALQRDDLDQAARIEVNARLGYVQLEQDKLDDAQGSLEAAVSAWKRASRIEDSYYIAMANFYLGEIEHRRFQRAPLRSSDVELAADMEAKRVILMKAYNHWRTALAFKIAYWATASGFHMSEIFYEYWKVAVTAPYPDGMQPAARPAYVVELHDKVRENLEKSLDGHSANVDLAAAYGVDTDWSLASRKRATEIAVILDREARGENVVP